MNTPHSGPQRTRDALAMPTGIKMMLLAAGLTALTGCASDLTCTLVGCPTPLTVQVHSREWAPGRHTIEAAFPGSDSPTVTCTIDLPEQTEGTCSDGRLSLTASAVLQLVVDGPPPRQVDVSISRDDTALFSGTLEPDYEHQYPNGPDCGACPVTTMVLSMDDR